jgi:ABC-type transporter Mla subunit MlaD
MAGGAGHFGITAPSSFDLGTSVQQLADTITGLVDSSLAALSSTLANLSATVGQLTSSLSETVSHLTDGLTGTATSLTHDTPAGLLEPLVSNLLGSTQHATDFSGSTQHGASLLDTAGAIPTAALPPLPLHLGFLGQPTIDGHETHDGAFSALGVHHF